jgi:arginase family enzyme
MKLINLPAVVAGSAIAIAHAVVGGLQGATIEVLWIDSHMDECSNIL